jgi:hypothetical protein
MGGRYGSRRSTHAGRYNNYQKRLMSQQRTKNSIYGPGFRRGHVNNGSFRNNGNGNRHRTTFRNNGNRHRTTFRNANRKSLMGGFFEKFATEIKKIAN